MKTSCAFKPMSSLLHCLPAAELRGELLIGQRKEVCFGGGGASLWPFVSICSMTFALWSLLFPAHPHPVHIHHTSGLLWQHSPLTFLRHLHLLLIKWTGSDPPSRGTDREKDGVAMISSRRKYILLNGKLSRWTCRRHYRTVTTATTHCCVSVLMTQSFVHKWLQSLWSVQIHTQPTTVIRYSWGLWEVLINNLQFYCGGWVTVCLISELWDFKQPIDSAGQVTNAQGGGRKCSSWYCVKAIQKQHPEHLYPKTSVASKSEGSLTSKKAEPTS